MSNQPLSEKRFMHADQVRKLLGYASRASFWQAVRASGLPFIRVNQRRFLFDEEEVNAWLERRKVGGKR